LKAINLIFYECYFRTASIRRGGNQTLNRTGTRPGSGNGTRTGTGFEAETSGQIRQLKKQESVRN